MMGSAHSHIDFLSVPIFSSGFLPLMSSSNKMPNPKTSPLSDRADPFEYSGAKYVARPSFPPFISHASCISLMSPKSAHFASKFLSRRMLLDLMSPWTVGGLVL
ncbi:hypothetical protein Mapa_015344 [Marchantia paleacea]|nr:hypothetical protein Mapa_015344 [Marchantia paleacea]